MDESMTPMPNLRADPPRPSSKGFRPGQKLLLRIFQPFMAPWVRLERFSFQEPWKKQPCLFVFNHNNGFETFLAAYILMMRLGVGRVSFLVDWMYGRIPLLGWLLNQFDTVYVYNKPARYRVLDRLRYRSRPEETTEMRCIQVLRQGRHLALFPEGKRNRDPLFLLRGRLGAARIARKAAVPVVPVGIEFQARFRRITIPRIGRATFRIGEPLAAKISQNPSPVEPHEKRKFSRQCARITLEIMRRLELLCGKLCMETSAAERKNQ